MKTSQHILVGVGIATIATALLSFSGEKGINKDDESKKKYHVLHQKDGEMVEYDTIIPMSSEYTVHDFLADKGIDDADVKIIEVPSVSNMTFISENGEGTNVFMHKMDEDITIREENGERTEVKIIREENDKGEVTLKKFVNGEEVEVSEGDMKQIRKHGDENHHKIIIKEDDGDLKWVEKTDSNDVEMKVEVDEDGNMKVQKFVNGEEVEVTDEELNKIQSGQDRTERKVIIIEGDDDLNWTPKNGEKKVEINVEVDEEGTTKVQKFVNGEEVPVSEEELEQINNGHDSRIMVVHGDQDGNLNIDSIISELDFDIEVVEDDMKDGQKRIIIKEVHLDSEESSDDSHEVRKEFRVQSNVAIDGDEENFTIVLVHENYDESMEENMEVQMIVEEENENISSEREMALNEPISVYPNPNTGTFTIAFNQKNEAKTSIRVVDAQGKVVYKEKLGSFSGSYKKELDLKKNGVGVYIVTVQQGGETSSRKVIVE